MRRTPCSIDIGILLDLPGARPMIRLAALAEWWTRTVGGVVAGILAVAAFV